VAALLLLDASGSALGTMGLYLDETLGRVASLALLLAALAAWMLLPLALAVVVLRRRDL
jgi:hypothetical protein